MITSNVTNRVSRYEQYIHSGVLWLGDIPSHWSVKKLKHVSSINPSKAEARDWLEGNKEVAFLPMEKVGTDGRINSNHLRLVHDVWSGFTYFRKDDVILAKITPCFENGKGAWLGTLPTQIGFGSTEFHVLRAGKHLHPRFLYLLTSNSDFRLRGTQRMTGSAGQQRVPVEFVQNFEVPIPTLEEQQAIVRFLDRQDRRINRFIRAKRRLIDLLNEQKQAIIHQAVTRGLDPSVPLKASGIDWLGDIPAHWELKPLRQLCRLAGGMTPSKSIPEYWLGDIPWVSPKDMKSFEIDGAIDHLSEKAVAETGLSIIPKGAVLTVVRGMILARKVPIAVNTVSVTINQDMKAMLPHRSVAPYYLAHLLTAASNALFPLIDEAGHGTKRLPTGALLNVQLPVPPLSEQTEIASLIRSQFALNAQAMSRAQREMELIREYRTRLFADVVTGKLDVRNHPDSAEGASEDIGDSEDLSDIQGDLDIEQFEE